MFPTPTPAHVAAAVARIVPAFRPRRIVVFGSVARGEARPGSDLDLLVVLDRVNDRRTARRLVAGVLADLDVPEDVVVTTPEEVERRRDSVWHIVGTALREGQTVYDAG